MQRVSRLFILAALPGLILVSCGLGASKKTSAENALPEIQATAPLSLADQVVIELSTQVDTTLPYNAVGQFVKFKYIVKMVRNDSANTPPNLAFTGATPACQSINAVGNLNDRLDAGETLECTFDYPLTQADLDKAFVSNVVTVVVYTVNSNTVATNVPTIPSKLLTLTKTADPASYYQTGQAIKFNYAIKNSGSSQLGPGPFTITDSGINNNAPFTCGDANATLASGATLTCSATYTVTASDMGAASAASVATAAGGGANPSAQVSVTINKTSAPALTVGATIQHQVAEGEWLWQIARCYGADPKKAVAANPQIADPARIKAGMTVTIPNIGSNGQVHTPPCVARHLVQTGETWTSIAQKYGADPGLTQRANANTLSVGKEVNVPLYTAGLNLPLLGSTTVTPGAAFTLNVTASPNTYSQAGQAITLNYEIKNTGSTTLGPAQFTVTEALAGSTPINCGASNTTLAPGATVACAASYSVTPANMDAASFISSATAAGVGLVSPAVSAIVSKSVTQISLTVSANPSTYSQAGQVITLTYTIRNSGTVPLGPAQFTVLDSLLGPSPINCGNAGATIAANGTVTCTAARTITDADMAAASITSNAVASGAGAPSSQTATLAIPKQ